MRVSHFFRRMAWGLIIPALVAIVAKGTFWKTMPYAIVIWLAVAYVFCLFASLVAGTIATRQAYRGILGKK